MANEILTFGESGGANIVDQTTYSGSTIRTSGHTAGKALSAYANKTWRQAMFTCHMIAEFTAEGSGNDVLDNADDAGFLANYRLALKNYIESIIGTVNYAVDTGTANAVAVTIPLVLTVPADLTGKLLYIRKSANDNTGAVTITVNTLVSEALILPNGQPLLGHELPASGVFATVFDGANFQLLSIEQTNSRDFVVAGNPNGTLPGDAGSAVRPPDRCWDIADSKWWTCIVSGNAAAAVWATGIGGNTIILSTDADFYISPTGSDTTGNGTLASPWLTIAHAVTYITANVIAGFHYINVHLAAGTYAASGTNGAIINVPGGNWNILGAGSGSTTIHASGANYSCIGVVSSTASVSISGVTLLSDNGYGIKADGGGTIFLNSDVTFGLCASAHIDSSQGATVAINSSYLVSGNATYHWAADNGRIVCGPGVNISSSVSIALTNFAFLADLAFLSCSTVTFSGYTGTGSQHNASANSVIQTQGKTEATFFPGTASSFSRTTGAQWL